MATASRSAVHWADDETLRLVRPEVRRILENSAGFKALAPEEQRNLAGTMVKVCSYMVNPEGLAKQELSTEKGGVLALAEDPTDATRRRLSESPGSTGKDFHAGAVREGVEQFGEMVKKVDFPAFVSGLIKGVFQAIVDSSIQQMHAYGELVANVAKTVDQFAQDNITPNNGRDWLAQKFPDDLQVDVKESDSSFDEGTPAAPPQPVLSVKSENPEEALAKISQELNLAKAITDLSDPAEEERLVLGARLQMARGRQQLLSSMVLLGINRIVVTDGLIHAKVVFDMRASDTQKRKAHASMYDRSETSLAAQTNMSYSSWLSPVSADVHTQSSYDHVATVGSAVDDSSESKAQVKAQLSGEVRVNFKSDYLPMEKMASPQMIAAIQGNATPVDRSPKAPAAPGAPPPPAAAVAPAPAAAKA